MRYQDRRVLITGGLGFIGSNLAVRLVEEGAEVTVVDSLLPGCGSNLHNIAPVRDRVRLVEADIADTAQLRSVLRETQIIFNLAGEISHIHSMQYPERDLQVNTVAQLRFLLACKEACPGVRIVYAGTRQVYGAPKYLPVDEAHQIQPVDFNGVHKAAAAMYHHMMTRTGDIDGIVLRLTNVYGPRMALDVVCQGFLSTYIRRSVLGQGLEIYGDGQQRRDPVYVDDAVNAFLVAGQCHKSPFRTYNVGGPEALTLADIAKMTAAAASLPEPRIIPFPADRKPIDIGSYCTNSNRISRELGWKAKVRFADGIARTLHFYHEQLPYYLNGSDPNPSCRMPEHSGKPWAMRYAEVG